MKRVRLRSAYQGRDRWGYPYLALVLEDGRRIELSPEIKDWALDHGAVPFIGAPIDDPEFGDIVEDVVVPADAMPERERPEITLFGAITDPTIVYLVRKFKLESSGMNYRPRVLRIPR